MLNFLNHIAIAIAIFASCLTQEQIHAQNDAEFRASTMNAYECGEFFGEEAPLLVLSSGIGTAAKTPKYLKRIENVAAKGGDKVKYIGRMEDLKDIPRSQTLLDDLPDLGNPKANYYQNMSVLRKALRDGYTIKDASWFRPNSELAPTLLNPNRTVGQTFLGAERLLLQNRGLRP